MAEWGRDTPWRQGHILPTEVAKELGLSCPRDPDATIVVVISHDCDLAQLPFTEPNVEVIAGCVVNPADGNLTYAKNVRRLHLPFQSEHDDVVVDLVASEKLTLPKAKLAQYAPRSDLRLHPSQSSILQNWLAARYRRAAFPDEFDRRLEDSGLREKIGKILKSHGVHISAIFFDVDDGEEKDREGSTEPFVLDIYLLHTTSPDPAAAEHAANDAKARIEKVFKQRLNPDGKGWKEIELRSCDVISDEALTFKQSRILKQWRQDHVSLRDDPPQEMVAE